MDRESLHKLHCFIYYFYSVKVSNIERPSQYESAIRSKERAREDIQVRVVRNLLSNSSKALLFSL